MKFKKTIAIVDDEHLFRKGFIRLTEDYKHIEVLFEAENGQDAVEKLKVRRPDVIFLDIDMPIMDGIEATELIRERYPKIKIIILSSDCTSELMYSLFEKGAHAFLSKKTDVRTILKVIDHVIEKGYYFDNESSKAMVSGIRKSKGEQSMKRSKLSGRELEVAELICRQLSTREIADTLCLGMRTIETYRGSIFEKTGSRNVVGVVLYAMKYKLFDFI